MNATVALELTKTRDSQENGKHHDNRVDEERNYAICDLLKVADLPDLQVFFHRLRG
uniref:Uncharacterized protein n=1 Tax=Hyaloperonospora arabidopsidis (strain Emoy2) TaxID=559515 RepID=M4BMK5_HYAAE